MTTLSSTTYTPLESLLLFQALRLNGVDSTSFTKISSELKSIPLVHNDPAYNAARLAPEALRQLYLDLLKEEAKRDLEKHSETNGDSPNTRKRKAPSPKLPSVHEASQHSHLIPQLLTRLYMRYRENTVAIIREHEAKHAALTSEALRSKNASADAGRPAMVKRLSQARIDDMLNKGVPPDVDKVNATHRRSSSGNSMPSLSDLAGLTPSTTPKPAVNAYPAQPGSPYQQSAGFQPPRAANAQMQPPRTTASPRPVYPASNNQDPATMHYPAGQPSARHAQLPQQYYNGQQNAYPQPVPTGRGGVMLPPFQIASADAARMQQYPQQQYPAQAYHTPQGSPYPTQQQQYFSGPATGPRFSQRAGQHPLSGLVAALATPPRQARSTVWKSETRPPPPSAPGSPKRPDVEPLSPLLNRAPSPSRGTRQRPSAVTRTSRRQTSQADVKRDLRSASVESSAPDSEDTYSGRRKVKVESSVVRDSEERDEALPSGTVTRRRRGTLPSGSLAAGVKRQHQASTLTSRDDDDEPRPRSNTILATRNLGRMSGVIMNEIVSHRHGSRFAQPVRDSHADGYSTFIKRPQDLKSIRAAISQGGKAIAAATANLAESPAPGNSTAKSNDATVELERSIDLIPPKAIVNGAQLEKEIMRMFANAVMFNPGEDGMVADTREMFEDVESKIAEWRGAEREIGSADDEDEARVKRRKL